MLIRDTKLNKEYIKYKSKMPYITFFTDISREITKLKDKNILS